MFPIVLRRFFLVTKYKKLDERNTLGIKQECVAQNFALTKAEYYYNESEERQTDITK